MSLNGKIDYILRHNSKVCYWKIIKEKFFLEIDRVYLV